MSKEEINKLKEELLSYRIRNMELQTTYNKLKQENYKIGLRLDACLFSMVLMQNEIRKINKDTLALAT